MTHDARAAARRPRSTLRVLATLLVAVLAALGVLGACVRTYVDSVPARTISVARAELTPGMPKFVPVTSFGSVGGARDTLQTHGVWITVQADGSATAFISRGPARGCWVFWSAKDSAYRDDCTLEYFAQDGSLLLGEGTRGLDGFHVTASREQLVIDLDRTILGACHDTAATGCSRPGAPAERRTPR